MEQNINQIDNIITNTRKIILIYLLSLYNREKITKYFSAKFKIDELTKTSTSAIFIPTRRCFYFSQIQMKEKENEKNNQWNQKLLQRSKKRN